MRAAEKSTPAPHGLSFAELKDLIEHLESLQDGADASMGYFRHLRAGFENQVDPAKGPTKTSKASTATCLAYLEAAGKLNGDDWDDRSKKVLRSSLIRGRWRSAGLPENNPFTSAFLLEAIFDLGGRDGLTPKQSARLTRKIRHLNDLLRKDGGLQIERYPRTAFLTHKVVRVLLRWSKLDPASSAAVSAWNWSHLYQESMLIASESPDADYFELAYSVLTASLTTNLDRMTPRERRLLQHAIAQFFRGQRDDGNWPRSRPLFLYPNIGYAYCYDYELLVQLLSERPLRPFVLSHLPKLRTAAHALVSRRVPLGDGDAFGWSSEHHGGHFAAESWPTASVLHFCFELQDLVFDAVRQDLFQYVDAIYDEPRRDAPANSSQLLKGLMDSTVRHGNRQLSFKSVLEDRFLLPLVAERNQVRDGQPFSEISISAILFGPPGTSKTRLAQMIADALGWPLLSLDPSHLTRRGLDNVHAEANELFGRLRFADQTVVLMDEFDELVREREGTGELQSRFLTTAMLPKIAALHERRRLVYLVATNHVEQFDAAISRPGRFDLIVPVLPPSTAEKLAKWSSLAVGCGRLIAGGADQNEIDAGLEDLTYAEAEELAKKMEKIRAPQRLRAVFDRAVQSATLNQYVDPDGGDEGDARTETWKDRLSRQQAKIRGLGT